jgi:hypothetical protein
MLDQFAYRYFNDHMILTCVSMHNSNHKWGENPNLWLHSKCENPCIQFLSCSTAAQIKQMFWGTWFPFLDKQATQLWLKMVKNIYFSNIFILSSTKHAFQYTLHNFTAKMKSLIHTWAWTMKKHGLLQLTVTEFNTTVYQIMYIFVFNTKAWTTQLHVF